MLADESPYLFRASSAKFIDDLFNEDGPQSPNSRSKLARMKDGIELVYQERFPNENHITPWCDTGHTIAIISGHLKLEFADHEFILGPGDMAHIPAGSEHRHRGSVYGNETVKYFFTMFSSNANPETVKLST